MLQWLGPDFQSHVIYNDQEGNRFVARVVEVSTRSRRTVGHAVYAVHPSGRTALGVRFERHYFCRAYHYEGIRDDKWKVPIHPDDGILAIDLESGTAHLAVRTAAIAAFEPTPDMANVAHWLEHLVWNPSGTRFIFLHRFGSEKGFGTRVFTAGADGTRLFCLPGHMDHTFTHMGWRDDNQFVNYAVHNKPATKAYASMVGSSNSLKAGAVWAWRTAKRVLPRQLADQCRGGSGYLFVKDQEKIESVLSTGRLHEDGHPSWTRDGRFMLTDTYADEAGFRHLLLYDAEADRLHAAGRFVSPFNSCAYRCDLHPRFSRDERRIILDTAHTGRHQVMVLEVDWGQLR
jgi:hypothetical protein